MLLFGDARSTLLYRGDTCTIPPKFWMRHFVTVFNCDVNKDRPANRVACLFFIGHASTTRKSMQKFSSITHTHNEQLLGLYADVSRKTLPWFVKSCGNRSLKKIFVSNYFAFWQDILQRATLIAVLTFVSCFATFQISKRFSSSFRVVSPWSIIICRGSIRTFPNNKIERWELSLYKSSNCNGLITRSPWFHFQVCRSVFSTPSSFNCNVKGPLTNRVAFFFGHPSTCKHKVVQWHTV